MSAMECMHGLKRCPTCANRAKAAAMPVPAWDVPPGITEFQAARILGHEDGRYLDDPVVDQERSRIDGRYMELRLGLDFTTARIRACEEWLRNWLRVRADAQVSPQDEERLARRAARRPAHDPWAGYLPCSVFVDGPDDRVACLRPDGHEGPHEARLAMVACSLCDQSVPESETCSTMACRWCHADEAEFSRCVAEAVARQGHATTQEAR